MKERLLKLLRDFANQDMPGARPDHIHEEAEEQLLALLGDPEITAAWKEAANYWWYA